MHFNFICIEGNIGVGKTTLVKKLAEHFKANALYEVFKKTPLLSRFYYNPQANALALESFFLKDRKKQLFKITKNKAIQKKEKKLFSDYCLDKCLIFSKINLEKEQFTKYKKLHEEISETLITPDLVIVIHGTTDNLIRNIAARNRKYEKKIKFSYLEKLNKSYKKFFKDERPYYILNIFTEDLSPANYKKIFDTIVSFLQQKPAAKNTTLKL
jgi:deoxyguanosine kinase